ncbi:hypothetical protein Mal15_25640 [Stieleria maiorica]|uniref:FlgN protein n=1 Tax=Stieleria maiorica TaxID=2795974 RepID=A0A5B9MBE9_9BACT|nr:hypothetical protein [Stieleria maiorica]QEF98512.1 hypothetical protein Mal15_25640 [Stieleria maiorica]
MNQQKERLGVLVERQLRLESGVVDALDALNNEMSALLDNSGIYGPNPADLKELSPLIETLQNRQSDSRKSRQVLQRYAGTEAMDESGASIKSILSTLPKSESKRLESDRRRIHDRLSAARQKLTANQVVIFYSTEFHRRYLLGVLQCDVDEGNYKADGQPFKLPPEKIIGRNC